MKKLLLTLCVSLASIASMKAQSLTEVLYLKNGSIIKGTVIELVANESVKIQTADGSVFVYPASDVLRITKEQTQKSRFRNRSSVAAAPKAAHKGYKGYVELGGGIGVGDWAESYLSLNTSHGYQLNPYLFLGAGIGYKRDFGNNLNSLPLFADVKWNMLNKNITPVLSTKLGGSVSDVKGVFFNPAIGCRFGLSKNAALHLSLNYELQTAKCYIYYYYGGQSFYAKDKILLHNLGLNLAVEF